MTQVGQYREYLRIPGVKPLLFASTFGRLSYAMVSLAIFFQVQSITGSVGTAGLAVGLSSGLGAMTAGPRGLIVDRFAQTRPLFAFVPAYAVSCLLLAFVARDALSAVLLSGLIGLTAPPINISIRPLWLDIVGQDRVRMAYSVDTAYHNLVMLLGPVIATLVALNVSPKLGDGRRWASACSSADCSSPSTRTPRPGSPRSASTARHGLLRSPAIRFLAVEGALMGLSAGFITIGIPALATLSGEEGMAGPVMSAMGVGAIIGTLWAGAKAKEIAPVNGLRAATLLFAIALLPLAFVPIGPVDDGRGPGRLGVHRARRTSSTSRSSTWSGRGARPSPHLGTLWMIEGAGMALGNAIGGVIAESVSPHLTLALGSLFALASPILFTIGMRGVLKPATRATADQALDAATT